MDNPPVTFGPPLPLNPLLIPGKTIQAIALIGTSKEWLIANPQRSTPTSLNHQLAIRNIQACSGWSAASQNLPWPHLSLIIQVQHVKM
ncbi:hypothetical protein O181_018669 [Austropuccinia psidii MF-1]|uniref:Uncharacterized protein n=1 Tax=Austropuccinia psidii MF-1 TaxID=1389203 RepID=A0A9Q3C841_9BASI|nr:hypothetical protein [Austropuccinia psidii MF-1]